MANANSSMNQQKQKNIIMYMPNKDNTFEKDNTHTKRIQKMACSKTINFFAILRIIQN